MLLSFCWRSSTQPKAATSSVVVNTVEGRIRGIRRDGVREFLGIPYAEPPVGNLRWRPPEQHERWNGVIAATRMGPSCPQSLADTADFSTAENCLFLNVYAPDSSLTRWPAMVWIHGGAFIFGSGAFYDGSALARKHKLIVVTINYRLGALGFLTLPGLEEESPIHMAGNYGLLDQQAALKWVRRNIVGFGGDPGKVTIAGESAGGISVCDQLVSPAASGLFRAAIIESGPCVRQATMASREKTGHELATKLGCDTGGNQTACLRSKSAQQVFAAMPGSLQGPLVWGPVVDGHVLPLQPVEAFRSDKFNKVPVINGSNHNEGTLFVAFGQPLSAENYPAVITSFANPPAAGARSTSHDKGGQKVMAEYPLEQYGSASEGLAAVLGDAIFSCPIQKTNQLLSAFVPAYEYEFNDRNAPSTLIAHPPFPLGAFHAAEIPYIFQTYFPARSRADHLKLSAAQTRLSDDMAGYWSSFIKTEQSLMALLRRGHPRNPARLGFCR